MEQNDIIEEVIHETFKQEFEPIARETVQELKNYIEEFPRIPTLKFLCVRGVIKSDLRRINSSYRRTFYRWFWHEELWDWDWDNS